MPIKITKRITKRTIDNVIVDSLFGEGCTDNEQTALKKIITELESKGVEYTMSSYVEKIYKEVYGND